MSAKRYRLYLLICMAWGFLVPGLRANDLTVTWDPPTTNTDGTPLVNLAGYRVYYGTASLIYSSTVDVGLAIETTVTNLQPGLTYFFAVSDYNSEGGESVRSDELSWISPPLASPVDHFTWGPIASPQTVDKPFAVSIMARSADNTPVTDFTGTVHLGGPVALTPTNTTAFVNGLWSGQVTVQGNGSNIVLTAIDSGGHSGTSVPFSTALKLAVSSAYDDATPPAGDISCLYGSILSCAVTFSQVTQGGTQYVCRGWTGTGSVPASGTDTNTGAITLTANSTIAWNWTTNYFFSLAIGPHGVCTGSTSGWYSAGGSATVTATPNANYHFVGWAGDTNGCVISSNRITVSMNQARSISAAFELTFNPPASFTWNTIPSPQTAGVPFPVSIQAKDSNNTPVTDFTGTVHLGGPVALTPTNTTAFVNGLWSGQVTVQGNGANIVLTAIDSGGHTGTSDPFTTALKLAVSSAYDDSTPPAGDISCLYGSVLSCAMTSSQVAQGGTQYVCRGWTGTGSVPASGTDTNTGAITLTANSTITWNWATNYFFSLAIGPHGVCTGSTSGWYAAGGSATVTATSDANYHFAGWAGDTNGCVISSNRITVSMNQARSISAAFELTFGPLASFNWNSIPSPQAAGVPFPVTIQAKDANNITITNFARTVTITGIRPAGNLIVGASTSSSGYPMYTANQDARTQVIYLTNEIGRACVIKALALNVSTLPGQTLRKWSIRMKHTSLGNYIKQSGWDSTAWTTVYQNDQTVSATGWVEFAFSVPFSYNGRDNLMVDFSFNNSNSTRSGSCRYTSASKNRTLYSAVNSTYGDPLTWSRTSPKPNLSTLLPNIRLQVLDPVGITPTNITGFVNGVWSGNVSVSSTAMGLALSADDGAGHMGYGNLFDVLGLPETALMIAGTTVEPAVVTPAGFSNITQARAGGIPPFVSLRIETEGLKMGIWGTVGADILVQTSSNPANPLAWELLESLLMTNVARSIDGTPLPAPRDTLEAAYVPAIEWLYPSSATSYLNQYFRVVMPYNYAVLADKVLKTKGFHTRLIVIRLPGETVHDVCYVNEDKAYIDCSEDRFILALNHSGETIREIADDYSAYVNMNWTSASEFTYTNGGRQLIATVVKTDPPSSDPPLASSQTSGIEVDF